MSPSISRHVALGSVAVRFNHYAVVSWPSHQKEQKSFAKSVVSRQKRGVWCHILTCPNCPSRPTSSMVRHVSRIRPVFPPRNASRGAQHRALSFSSLNLSTEMKGGARALFTFTDSLKYYSFLAQNYKHNLALISWRFRSIFCPSYGVSSPSYPSSSCSSSLASSKVNTISYLFKHSVYAMKNSFNIRKRKKI